MAEDPNLIVLRYEAYDDEDDSGGGQRQGQEEEDRAG